MNRKFCVLVVRLNLNPNPCLAVECSGAGKILIKSKIRIKNSTASHPPFATQLFANTESTKDSI
jgi:hypothetical protein